MFEFPMPQMTNVDNEYHIGQFVGSIGSFLNPTQVDHMMVQYYWNNEKINALIISNSAIISGQPITSVTVVLSGFSSGHTYYDVDISDQMAINWEENIIKMLKIHWENVVNR